MVSDQDENSNESAAIIILGWKRDGDGFITSKGKRVDKVPSFSSSVPDATSLLRKVASDLKLDGKVSFSRSEDGSYRCVFSSEGKTMTSDGASVPSAMLSMCLLMATTKG